jgi:hypothetical protein
MISETFTPYNEIDRLFFLNTVLLLFTVSFQFDLQWLMLHCDPTKPEREKCDEIPVSNSEKDYCTKLPLSGHVD